jgi:hypothetical protein
VKTAQQALANWQGSQGRAVTAYEQGVQSYSGDWAGQTVQQQATLVNNFNQAVNSGRWAAGVNAVGTPGWKSRTQAKSPNYGQGFSAGAQDYGTAIGKVMNALQSIVPNLPQRGTFEQNKLRSTTLMDALHAQRGQLGAR